MKKYFKLMSLFLGLMICTPAFVACGDDDDDDAPAPAAETPQQVVPETEITGGWKINISANAVVYGGSTQQISYLESMAFNSDGSFVTEAGENSEGNTYKTKYEGTWSKLGSDRVVVSLTAAYSGQDGNYTPDQHFQAHNDTLGYFFKGNALFCESIVNGGYFAYTRDGNLPFSGFGDYSNSPVLGIWQGQDFAWDGTPIDLQYELRSDGTFFCTQDNHQGWSEGTAGYYILDGGRIMFINYYFISKMNSGEDKWDIVGFRMWGGHWFNFRVEDNKLYGDGFMSMSDEVDYLVKQGTTSGKTIVGHWKSTETIYYEVPETEDEYWEIEQNGAVRHWWIRNGQFASGTMGTYELTTANDKTYIVCHWSHFLVDSGNNANPRQGEETGREPQNYTLQYVYSNIADALLVQWSGSDYFERFKRIN